MAKTYTPIATQTLTSNVSTITFSSISSAYTDLVLVASPVTTTSGNNYYLQFNSDTGSNYSDTSIRGSGAASSGRHSSASVGYVAFDSSTGLNNTVLTASIQNYSNTTTYKTILSRYSQASAQVNATITLWRSTAAINAITIGSDGGTLALGGTFTLYGILKA